MEERHRRADLHRVDRPEDPDGRPARRREHQPGALAQARAEHRVRQVGTGLVEGRKRVEAGRLAPAEPGDLREDEPDPVAGLASGPELGDDVTVDETLGSHEPLEVERHRAIVPAFNGRDGCPVAPVDVARAGA